MTTSNFNRNLVQVLQTTFIKGIKERMTNRGLNQIEFKTPFRIYTDEQGYSDDMIRVPWGARSLFQDGNMLIQSDTGDYNDGSVMIDTLDIYELALIMDILESGDYTTDDDEEFIDPAGGRGLQSHI